MSDYPRLESIERTHVNEIVSPTLKGSLSVLKLMPGTYFNHTGIPLQYTVKECDCESQHISHINTRTQTNTEREIWIMEAKCTQSSTKRIHKVQSED